MLSGSFFSEKKKNGFRLEASSRASAVAVILSQSLSIP